jgi:hypothetical protein
LVSLLLRAGVVAPPFGLNRLLGAGLFAAGGVALVAALVLQGRSVQRTRYRPRRWAVRDTVVALCAGLFAAAYVAVRLLWPAGLAYSPYPLLAWPTFHPALGALLLLLSAPAWFAVRRRP